MRQFRLGMVINPYAGIGGALALKGSDGAAIRREALAAGAPKQAGEKMKKALAVLAPLTDNLHVLTGAGEMGAQVCEELGLSYSVVYHPEAKQTEGEDTEAVVGAIMANNADLLLFAGGDGTARNVCNRIDEQPEYALPVIGVPAGCKIHSGVYAVTPTAAGEVVAMMVKGELVSEIEAEVRDIDERAFREGRVLAKHYGELVVPHALTYVQGVKMGGKESDEMVLDDIAAFVDEIMEEEPQTYFVMGSGSTVANIMAAQDLANTLLGVDVVKEKTVVASDVTASELLQLTSNQPTKLIITVIGGQGHIFGRGNQQLSPAFLRQIGKENILVVATKNKLQGLEGRPLRLDTGDSDLDDGMGGYFSVITGYRDKVLYPAQ
ncbi:ATP-NAD kinase family protein [Alteromonas sp. C1M14]|uniref:ATP-NAD kinase family protein n=1 Tax=Alteromonas sp. C1M14 TaxID=2841567 RepID=UPI001C091678|nr:ATP-NAD kinase family protein [Alteromonas sp. C1M14]MBU2979753.1 ATP-NAD kinase family protein [Alteromonas sp. C1M14]